MCPLGGIPLIVRVRKVEPVAGGEGAMRRISSRQPSLRKADCSTDDDAECGPMSKLRGRGKEAKEDVVQT